MTDTDDEFVHFAEAASPRLRRTAFLLCGDWHTAEDLAQTTLAKVFVSWRRIRSRDAVSAYAMRTLLKVLRYWADQSVEQVAALLGCTPGNVKSQSARALAKLRLILDDIATESGSPSHDTEARQDGREGGHGRDIAPRTT